VPATLDHQAVFIEALRTVRSARCDQLGSQVWITPKRTSVIAHAIADCIIRTILSRPELQALDPIRNATARAAARRALEHKQVPALDEAALRMLDKLDQLEHSGEHAFVELFSASGVVAMCLIRAERAGIPHIGEHLAGMLEGLIAHQQHTVTVADANLLEDRANAAHSGRRPRTAATLYTQAAAANRALNRLDDAFRGLSNAAAAASQAGDHAHALELVEAALAMPIASERRTITAMTRGLIYDALDREDAAEAWVEAARLHTTPPGVAFCLGHAFGANAKHDRGATLAELAMILADGEPMTNGQRAGVIGAAGQSAGPRRGLALLAQAVLVMCETPDAWNTSTTRFWAELVEAMGYTTPAGLQLTALGWALTSLHKQSPDFKRLMVDVADVFERCARARGITVDQLQKLAVPPGPPGQVIERVNRDLRASIPADRWLPQRAPRPAIRPAGPLAGSGRLSRHHPRWANGQYANYFLERSDGSWVAISLLLADRPEGWLLVADTKEASREMHLLIEPVAAANGSLAFRPLGWSRRRGEVDAAAAAKNVTLVTSMLEAADLAGVAHTPAPPSAPLPCGLDEVHAVEVAQHDYTIRHELSARIPITGLARSTIRDRAFSLVVTSFGNSDPGARSDAFDDHVDFSHFRTIEHDGFALSYPATWVMNPLHSGDIDSPSNVQARDFSAGCGGNVTSCRCMVTLYTGSVEELDRLGHDMVARWSVRNPARSGTFVPKGEHESGGKRAFVHHLEHPFQTGFDIAALVRSDGVLATVVVFWNVLKTHPLREQLLHEAQRPVWDIIASFELRAATSAGAARVLN
jgi:hypothetical protein